MNGRKLFRQYAQDMHGREAVSFVEIYTDRSDFYTHKDILVTLDSKGNKELTAIDYKQMVHWMIKNHPTQ